MSTDTHTLPDNCPSQLDLSSYTDREGAEHVAPHLEACPSCKTVVAFYSNINDVVKKNIAPADGLAERVKCACRREREAAERRRHFQLVFWRAAAVAAMVIAAVAIYVTVVTGPKPAETVTTPALAAAEPPATASEAPGAAAVAKAPVPDTDEDAPAGTALVPEDLANVGTGSGEFGTAASVHIAPNRVRHVWVVKDLDYSTKLFCSLIPSQAKWKQDGSPDECASYQVALSDKELQSLVDNLAAVGFSLVSPSFPQPGEKRKLLASGRTVIYDVDLVPAQASAP